MVGAAASVQRASHSKAPRVGGSHRGEPLAARRLVPSVPRECDLLRRGRGPRRDIRIAAQPAVNYRRTAHHSAHSAVHITAYLTGAGSVRCAGAWTRS